MIDFDWVGLVFPILLTLLLDSLIIHDDSPPLLSNWSVINISFILIPKSLNLGLQTSFQATKGIGLNSLDPTFGNQKKFLWIVSRSSLLELFLWV